MTSNLALMVFREWKALTHEEANQFLETEGENGLYLARQHGLGTLEYQLHIVGYEMLPKTDPTGQRYERAVVKCLAYRQDHKDVEGDPVLTPYFSMRMELDPDITNTISQVPIITVSSRAIEREVMQQEAYLDFLVEKEID